MLASGPSEVEVMVEGPEAPPTVTIRGVAKDEVLEKRESRFQVVLARDSSYAVHVAADGYEPRIATVRSVEHPAYYLNLMPQLAGITSSFVVGGSMGQQLLWGGTLITLGMMAVDEFTKSSRWHQRQSLVIPMRKRVAAPDRAE